MQSMLKQLDKIRLRKNVRSVPDEIKNKWLYYISFLIYF